MMKLTLSILQNDTNTWVAVLLLTGETIDGFQEFRETFSGLTRDHVFKASMIFCAEKLQVGTR